MKAIAVPYIIAIVLGVGVIGLIGYWLFISGGQFGTGVSANKCDSDALNFCNQVVSGQKALADWAQTSNCVGVGKYATLTAVNCQALGVSVPAPRAP